MKHHIQKPLSSRSASAHRSKWIGKLRLALLVFALSFGVAASSAQVQAKAPANDVPVRNSQPAPTHSTSSGQETANRSFAPAAAGGVTLTCTGGSAGTVCNQSGPQTGYISMTYSHSTQGGTGHVGEGWKGYFQITGAPAAGLNVHYRLRAAEHESGGYYQNYIDNNYIISSGVWERYYEAGPGNYLDAAIDRVFESSGTTNGGYQFQIYPHPDWPVYDTSINLTLEI